jgi:multidrug resistance protein MdtO
MTLASVLVLVLMLVLQMPFIAYGLYAVFMIGRESPSVSLRTGVSLLLTILLAIAIELGVVIVTDSDPMARVLSIAVITFLAALIVVGTSLPALGSGWGLIYCVVISFWERHAPADILVKNSLWLLAAFSLGVTCAVVVEYLFTTRSPVDRLEEQLSIRYKALEEMFSLWGQDTRTELRFEAANRVSRLAAAGQAGMIDLYNQIVDRNLDPGILPIATRVHITMLAELMDDAAAFGLQHDERDDPERRDRCAHISEQIRQLMTAAVPQSEERVETEPRNTYSLLDRVEATLHSILVMPIELGAAKNKELAVLPSREVPFFIPGAIRDRDNIAFALKISLCSTTCYVLYNAIDWPGTSTSVTTVMVAGLSTSAAMKQRLTFRLLGATIGGLILGLGATAFLFPSMDSITSLVVLVGSIAFVASWIAGGPRFNYVGLQLAFAFYLVAMEGLSAPTELAPPRDRFVGIVFALLVMWFVFDQIWPVRTVTAMRRVLASVLSSGASLFELIDQTNQHDEFLRKTDSLRDRLGKNISALRTMSDAVEYEFGTNRERHIRASETILRTALTAAALIWNQVAVLHDERDFDFVTEPGLVEMRKRLADRINAMAGSIERRIVVPKDPGDLWVSPRLRESERYGEYTRNTIARYEELQALTSMLSHEV